MTDRVRKVLIIGTTGYERNTEAVRIECVGWSEIPRLPSVRDFDSVIIDLLPLNSEESKISVDWDAFFARMNPRIVWDILMNRGEIIIIGDPRFSVSLKRRRVEVVIGETSAPPFLSWLGANFDWLSEAGTTVHFTGKGPQERFSSYIAHLRTWSYSLIGCQIFDSAKRMTLSPNLHLNPSYPSHFTIASVPFCCNKYQNGLAVELQYQVTEMASGRTQVAYGPIVLLPDIGLSDDETMQLVLTSICGIETNLPEPEWLGEYAAPGQKAIDERISLIRSEIQASQAKLKQTEEERVESRNCLKLLYEREVALETAVKDALRNLGAQVENPSDRDKEDGWVVINVAGVTREFVLEIKSAKGGTFNEYGLKQLHEWIYRGRSTRGKEYKGLFIGNSAMEMPPGKRENPFPDSWVKTAKLSHICAITTADLYDIHVLKSSGALDVGKFWEELFQTDGVFQMEKYWKAPEDGK